MKNKIKASHIFAVVVFVLLTLEGVIGVKSIRGLQNQLYTQIREYHELQEDYYNLQTVIERMNEDELFFCIYSELKDFDPVKRTGNLLVSFGVNDYEHFEEGRAVFDGTEHELQPDLQNLGYFDMEIPVTENTWIDQIEVSMTIAGKKYIRTVTPLMCGLSEYPLDAGYKDAVKISSDVIYKYSLFDMHQIKKQNNTQELVV